MIKSFKKIFSAQLTKILSLLVILVVSSLLPLGIASAQDQDQDQAPASAQVTTSAANAIENQNTITASVDTVVQNVSSLLALVVKTLNYILWPILFMIGGLMDNSLIFGPGVEDRLYLIWSQIRNLINLLFAVALIGVAIYNVLGLNRDGNYALKTFLPSMVITLVLVNFSFFGVRLALDVTNVATTAVFALPNAVEQGFSEERVQKIQEGICNNQSLEGVKSLDIAGQNVNPNQAIQGVNQVSSRLCEGNILSQNGRAQFQSLDKNNMGLVMAISFNRIADILDPSDLTISNPSFINLAVNLAIVTILQITYLSAYFALFAVLVARIIAMWIVTIASPLLVLKLGMSKAKLPGMSFLDSFDLESMFIKHATAPIKIGLAMSVGYMMLDVFQTVGSPSAYFPLGDDFTNVFSGVSSINDLFIAVAAIGIVWKVSFDAADGTFAESITNKYRSWAQGLSRSVRDLVVQKTPILPLATGKGGGQKALSIGDIASLPNTLSNKIGGKLDAARGVKNPNSSNAVLKNSNPALIINDSDKSKIKTLNNDQLKIVANSIAASDDPAFKSEFSKTNKERLIRTLKVINDKKPFQSADYNELNGIIQKIESDKDINNNSALSMAREFMKKTKGVSTYKKPDYDKELEAYKKTLKDE